MCACCARAAASGRAEPTLVIAWPHKGCLRGGRAVSGRRGWRTRSRTPAYQRVRPLRGARWQLWVRVNALAGWRSGPSLKPSALVQLPPTSPRPPPPTDVPTRMRAHRQQTPTAGLGPAAARLRSWRPTDRAKWAAGNAAPRLQHAITDTAQSHHAPAQSNNMAVHREAPPCVLWSCASVMRATRVDNIAATCRGHMRKCKLYT